MDNNIMRDAFMLLHSLGITPTYDGYYYTAYAVSLIIYQLGMFFNGGVFGLGTAVAFAALAALIFMLVRKNPYQEHTLKSVKA